MDIINTIIEGVYQSLIAEDRWKFYLEGIGNTLIMSGLACILGTILGLIISVIKVTNAATGKLKLLTKLCNLYTTVIRGTPVLLQLLIIYYVVFASAPLTMAVPIAALAFGLNSGAYVSELIRAGIMSIDKGQTEAGRSLGLNQSQTMRLIILPQAVKTVLPGLFNEFISLIKETSVAGYISVIDVTKAGDLVRTRVWTYIPLFISALIYLAIVVLLGHVQGKLERRFQAGDKR